MTEIGCMAHARRKFFELHPTNKSQIAEQALRYIQLLYEIESEVRDLEPDLRRRIRQEKAVPAMDRLHACVIAQRDVVPKDSATRLLDNQLALEPAVMELALWVEQRAAPKVGDNIRGTLGIIGKAPATLNRAWPTNLG